MPTEPPANFAAADRIVKPRRTQRKALPVIAVVGHDVLTEDGELLTLAELVARIPSLPPTLFAATGAADLLAYFDTVFAQQEPASWQWRATDNQRRIYSPTAKHRSWRVDVAVQFFGFKGGSFHKLIDPVTMYGKLPSQTLPPADDLIVQVLRWAMTLRSFCNVHNLEVKPTMGGGQQPVTHRLSLLSGRTPQGASAHQ